LTILPDADGFVRREEGLDLAEIEMAHDGFLVLRNRKDGKPAAVDDSIAGMAREHWQKGRRRAMRIGKCR
jgi:hypothetical protein